jgi:hypothetical protein
MKETLKYTLLILFMTLPLLSFSQRWKLRRAEVIVGFGASNYFGDIGGAADENNWMGLKDLDLFSTRPNISIGGRYRLTENMNLRGNVAFAYLEGTDLKSKNEQRQYAFSSSLFEFSGLFEYSLIPENSPVNFTLRGLWDGLRSNNANLNTYVFAGLGASYFDVNALDDLANSQRFNENKNLTLVIPAGVGIKYPVAPMTHIGLEIGGRWAATDYLDGLTTKWSNAYDIYYFSVLSVVFKMETYYRRRLRR